MSAYPDTDAMGKLILRDKLRRSFTYSWHSYACAVITLVKNDREVRFLHVLIPLNHDINYSKYSICGTIQVSPFHVSRH